MTHVTQVRDYYERNTRLFRAFGDDAATHTVHRAIWGRGVQSKTEALSYVNRQIVAELCRDIDVNPSHQWRVLDLGCGVGGTLCYLHQHLPDDWRGVGVSISPTQIRLARKYAQQLGIGDRSVFLEGNFLQLPFIRAFDVAIAIEALVHTPDIALFLEQAAHTLRPGGRLIICDDFLARAIPDLDTYDGDLLLVQAFRRGWHAPGISTTEQFVQCALHYGFRLMEQQNLTPYLRLLRIPYHGVQLLLRVARHIPDSWAFTQSLLGGLALQCGLRYGIFTHQWLVLEKTDILSTDYT